MRLRFTRGQPPSPDMLAPLEEVPEDAFEDQLHLPLLTRRLQPHSPDLPRLKDRFQGRRTTTPALDETLPRPKRLSPDPLNSSLKTKRRDVSHSLDMSAQPRTTLEGLTAVYLPKQKRWQTEPGRRKLKAEELQLVISQLQEKSRLLLLRLQKSLVS